MTDEIPDAAPARVPPRREPQRREWLWRALFEATLIVAGLLGGFAINEWKEGRDRQERVDQALAAVRAELASNRELLRADNAYNVQVADALKAFGQRNAPAVPGDVYPRGLVVRPTLISAAWDSARSTALINDFPMPTMMVLSQTYEAQRDYSDRMADLSELMYGTFFSGGPSFMDQPGTLGGILSDYGRRGSRLQASYDAAMQHLDETLRR